MEGRSEEDVLNAARELLGRVRGGLLARFEALTSLLRASGAGRTSRTEKLFNGLIHDELTALLTSDRIRVIWSEVLEMHATMPAQAEYFAQLLLGAYRQWSQFLTSAHASVLFRDDYLTFVTKSFCDLVVGTDSHSGGASHMQDWAALCAVAPKDCKKYLYRQLCKVDNPKAVEAIQSLSGHIVLEFFAVFLYELARGDDVATGHMDDILPALVRGALKNSSLDSVLSVALKSPLPPHCVRYLMGIWNKRDLMHVLWRTSRAWGDPVNVNGGNADMHSFFTSILISGLARISKDDMTLPCTVSSSDSLLSLLSSGVTHCLDAADSGIRERAMAVANAFSQVMGTKAVFEGKDFIKPSKPSIPRESKTAPGKNNPAAVSQKKDSLGRPDAEIEMHSVLNDGWTGENAWDRLNAILDFGEKLKDLKSLRREEVTEEDLESYLSEADLEAEAANAESIAAGQGPIEDPNKYRVSTLRECANAFRLPESELDLRQKQYGALLSIPDIVKADPIDASHMCAPLLRELLRLSNSFSIEDFDVIRMDAVLSLFVAYPKFSEPTLIWAVCSDDLSVGTRLEALACLAKSAYILAGLPAPEEELEQFETFKNNAKLAKRSFAVETEEPETKSDDKMRVIRPNRLRLMKKKEQIFRNRFGEIAESLFKPIAAMIFEKLVPKPKTNSQEVSNLSSKIELITIAGLPKISSASSSEFLISPRSSTYKTHPPPSVASTSLPPSKVDSTDGIDLLLPSQAILALATFLRCSINTFSQRPLTVALQHIGCSFRAASSLQLRRAAAIALHAVAASWAHLQSSSATPDSDRRLRMLALEQNIRTPIAHLMNIGRVMQELEDPGGDVDGNQQFVEVLAWISNAVHEEPDLSTRKVYLATMKIALDALKDSTGNL